MFMGKSSRKNKSNKPKKQNPKPEKNTKIEAPKESDTKPISEPNTENCVRSVTDYLKKVHEKMMEIENVKDISDICGRYAFRGLTKAKKHKLVSGARRAIAEAKGGDPDKTEEFSKYLEGANNKDFIDCHKKLIDGFKKKGHHKRDGQELSTLEILAETQHFGGRTLLMDFTKNALVALYFAVRSNDKVNARVYMVDYDRAEFKEFKNELEKADDKKVKVIDTIYSGNTTKSFLGKELYYWEAGLQNQRIPAQHSIFIFDIPGFPKQYFEPIDICRSAKPAIRNELDKVFDINGISLFNDIPGYAQHFRCDGVDEYDTALSLANEGEPDDAELVLTNLSDEHKKGLKYHELLARIYMKNNEHEKAIDEFTKALKIKETTENYFYRGNAYSKLGKHEKAIDDYNKAIKLNPDSAVTYNNRGVAKFEAGDHDGAIKDYNEAIRLKPDYAEAYYNRGGAKFEAGDLKGAINDYDEAIRLKPDYAEAYNNRGLTKAKLNANVEALDDFTKAIGIDPNNAMYYFNRGNTQSDIPEFAKAIQDFTYAIEIEKSYAYFSNRANAYSSLKKYDLAEKDYSTAIKLQPEISHLHIARCSFYLETAKKSEALKDAENAVKIDNQIPINLFFRGQAYIANDNIVKAKEDLELAEKLAIKNNDKKVLGMIRARKKDIKDFEEAE